MSTSPPRRVSVITPVYNGGLAFKAGLRSLKLCLPSKDQPSTEVIVVADGCTDGSDYLTEQFGATVIKASDPKGAAKARNLGAQQTKGEILFFGNADVTIRGDTFAQIEHLFSREPNLAAAIGSYDDTSGALNFLSQYKNLFHHYTRQANHEGASTFWRAGNATRRNVLLAIGSFDDRYQKLSIKDIKLGYRLKWQGYSIRLCKMLHVKHLKWWKPVSLLRTEFFCRSLPWPELLLNRNRPMNDLKLNPSTRLSVVLVFCIVPLLLAAYWYFPSFWIAVFLALLLTGLNASAYQFFITSEASALRYAWYFGTDCTLPTATSPTALAGADIICSISVCLIKVNSVYLGL